jgi:MerR family redox-sensitive transcriptional activator SoxR
MQQLTIGELARVSGLNPSALRYYESMGLLRPVARVNGQRRYDRESVNRLAVIRMAQEAGFSIGEIRTLLTGYPEATPASERWQDLARRKLPEVDALITRLQAVRAVLEESLRCDCLTLNACAELGWSHPVARIDTRIETGDMSHP